MNVSADRMKTVLKAQREKLENEKIGFRDSGMCYQDMSPEETAAEIIARERMLDGLDKLFPVEAQESAELAEPKAVKDQVDDVIALLKNLRQVMDNKSLTKPDRGIRIETSQVSYDDRHLKDINARAFKLTAQEELKQTLKDFLLDTLELDMDTYCALITSYASVLKDNSAWVFDWELAAGEEVVFLNNHGIRGSTLENDLKGIKLKYDKAEGSLELVGYPLGLAICLDAYTCGVKAGVDLSKPANDWYVPSNDEESAALERIGDAGKTSLLYQMALGGVRINTDCYISISDGKILIKEDKNQHRVAFTLCVYREKEEQLEE